MEIIFHILYISYKVCLQKIMYVIIILVYLFSKTLYKYLLINQFSSQLQCIWEIQLAMILFFHHLCRTKGDDICKTSPVLGEFTWLTCGLNQLSVFMLQISLIKNSIPGLCLVSVCVPKSIYYGFIPIWGLEVQTFGGKQLSLSQWDHCPHDEITQVLFCVCVLPLVRIKEFGSLQPTKVPSLSLKHFISYFQHQNENRFCLFIIYLVKDTMLDVNNENNGHIPKVLNESF